MFHYGINFEAGKIIKHALNSNYCKNYTNIQIAMDAPFHDAVADEKVRQKGPAETQMQGYSEDNMLSKIANVFKYVVKCNTNLIVIQIARGRSSIKFWDETVKPYLLKTVENIGDKEIRVYSGYRTKDYFNLSDVKENFVFVNIGMFARLNLGLNPGDIAMPIVTYDLSKQNDKLFVQSVNYHDKDLMNNIKDIPKLHLAGISDEMDFVTPDKYFEDDIMAVFKTKLLTDL